MSKKRAELHKLVQKLDPTRAKFTTLNPNGLSIDQRMPDIMLRLRVLERLFDAAASDWTSGATPSYHNPDQTEWSDWFNGLGMMIRDVRVIAEDCFEEGFAQGGDE